MNIVVIPNEILTDNRLSMGAKVLYCYLASKPYNLTVGNKEIQNSLNIKDSRTISKYWKELLNCGWLSRERNTDEKGQFTGGYTYQLLSQNLGKNTISKKGFEYNGI